MISRRDFVRWSASAGAWLYVTGIAPGSQLLQRALAAIPGGSLDPASIDKFVTPLLIPPVMPKAAVLNGRQGEPIDYYEISVRQINQQILPAPYDATPVWAYGAETGRRGGALLVHNAPSLTIEARAGRKVRVKWINGLKDDDGRYLPHLLPVDPTLHWANPPGGTMHRDSRPRFDETPSRYEGPVPIVPHLHGAVGVGDESDGYPEAWFLTDATDIPDGYAEKGTWYDFFSGKASAQHGTVWGPGYAVFQYPNENRAGTLWYHDHTLGMTRLNVYAGPAGFYIVRGGSDGDASVKDSRTGRQAVLPGPAPREGDPFPSPIKYREIPIAIQDRAFNSDGTLFYPEARDFFDGITGPFIPEEGGFSPIWNPEFFGNTMMVNGSTWPIQQVEQRRYRFRFLNGCQSRFLILDFAGIEGADVWQIGNEGGFLEAPYHISNDGDRLLMGLAERADVIVDFTKVEAGTYVLGNVGPDEPFGGGDPGVDFEPSDAGTTGQVMAFEVVAARTPDLTTPPEFLALPLLTPLPAESGTRALALIEMMGMGDDADGDPLEGPEAALLGTVEDGVAVEKEWMDPVSENPLVGATEVWEFYNTTGDAHPMHVHEVTFEVVNRQRLELDPVTEEPVQPLALVGDPVLPNPPESGFKDTVTAYPGQVTRVRARFAKAGQFVWHCHIVEHEDNEMMRPYRIGPEQPGQPVPMEHEGQEGEL